MPPPPPHPPQFIRWGAGISKTHYNQTLAWALIVKQDVPVISEWRGSCSSFWLIGVNFWYTGVFLTSDTMLNAAYTYSCWMRLIDARHKMHPACSKEKAYLLKWSFSGFFSYYILGFCVCANVYIKLKQKLKISKYSVIGLRKIFLKVNMNSRFKVKSKSPYYTQCYNQWKIINVFRFTR